MTDNRTLAVAGIRKAFDECEHDEETGMACDECLVDAAVKALEYADRERAAAVAAMTAERDAALEDAAFKELQRDEARGEHCSCCDAANAARESQWKELRAARADAETARLESALAREAMLKAEADAAAMRAALIVSWPDSGDAEAPVEAGATCLVCDASSYDEEDAAGKVPHTETCAVHSDAGRALLAEVARLREENAALKDAHYRVSNVLDEAKHEAGRPPQPLANYIKDQRLYVAALESEHEAATVLQAVDYRDAIAANREWVSAHAAVEALRKVKP